MSVFFWEFGGVQGKFNGRIGPLAGVTQKSVVVASITEVNIPPGSRIGSDGNFPFLGAANNMVIRNIVPDESGVVTAVIDTGWTGGPINVRVCLGVLGNI